MTTQPYRHPVPDDQTWVEAQTEDTMRSIVEWREIPGGRSRVGLDEDGNVRVGACGYDREDDPALIAQDEIETGSQVVGADDEWA
jgi:hypothetical protein